MNGKGGTGKTTVAALLAAHIIRKTVNKSILAIDADPNSCLAAALGVKEPETIVGICDDISKDMSKIPSGVTKDRYIEMRVQEAVTEEDGFDLVVMGRPEGPGCYCYVNNLLRGIIAKITKGYDFVIIDNAAGMEHISRRTAGELSKLLLVSDYSVPGVRSTGTIYALAKSLGIKIGGAYLVINKVCGPLAALKDEVDKTGLETIGTISYSEELIKWNISDKSIFEFRDKPIWNEVEKIVLNFGI